MSDETPVREGLCVFCGTARPVTKPVCPQCGRTWIDTKVGEEIPPLTPETVAASSEGRDGAAGADPAGDPESAEGRLPWGLFIGVLVGLLAAALVYLGWTNRPGDDDVAALATTTSTLAGTTAATTQATVATTTTTTAATTTSSSTTTTTTTTTTVPPIEPEGTAVPITDLTLGAFTLGPFSLSGEGAYLGRLVATLGQPDTRVAAGTDYGLCPNDDGAVYTWDGLAAIFHIEGDQELLVGYRLDATGSDHPTQSIATRSGLQLGDTVEKLDAIYLQSGLAFEDIAGTPHFILLRSADTTTLLWGPVTSTETSGTVTGIYSPQPCDGGPRPSA